MREQAKTWETDFYISWYLFLCCEYFFSFNHIISQEDPVGGERSEKRVWKDEHDANTVYTSMQIKKYTCWSYSRNVGRGNKGEWGLNSSMIYLIHCKNFCKYHNVPTPSTTIKNFKKFSLSLSLSLSLPLFVFQSE
jgi:hypothetical protein